MTTSTLTADQVDLAAMYRIDYRFGSRREVSGRRLAELLTARLLPGQLAVSRIEVRP